jgi:ankyrin repeat protein
MVHHLTVVNRFLLSKILVDQLLELPTVNMMLRLLDSAPKDLDQALEATMGRINAQPPAFRHLAHRALGWIVNAKRPLSVEELLHAFAVEDEGQDAIHPYSLSTPSLIVRACAGFVIVDENGALRMAHESIHTFCSRQMRGAREIENDIACTCVRYLRLKPMSMGPCTSAEELLERCSTMPFLMYAAKNIGEHVDGDLKVDDQALTLMIGLLDDISCRESLWQALFLNPDIRTPALFEDFFKSLPSEPTALHIAAYWNLYAVCEVLLSRGHPVSPLDSQRWSPLHWAAANGCEKVVALLLGAGADLDGQDSEGWTPLSWASFEGHTLVVQALLAAGANHLVTSGSAKWTALHWAVARNHMDVVKLLIAHEHERRKAQATVPPKNNGDAARQAVDLDLDISRRPSSVPSKSAAKPVDPDSLTLSFFDTIAEHLHLSPIASWKRWHVVSRIGRSDRDVSLDDTRLEAFRPLVSKLAWRNDRKAGDYAMAKREELVAGRPSQWKEILLQSAVAASNLAAARLLIELGANLDLRDPEVPFLETAVKNEDPQLIELLLSSGVPASCTLTNPHRNTESSLLHIAVWQYSRATDKTVSCLLRYGADIDATDNLGMTPLMVAVDANKWGYSRASSLVAELLSSGANMEVESAEGWTALDYACNVGNLESAELLRRQGARVTFPKLPEDTSWWSSASPKEVKEALDFFVSHGTDASAAAIISRVSEKSGQNLLTLAVQNRQWALAKYLASLGGEVPPAARIQDAIYTCILELSHPMSIWNSIDHIVPVIELVTRGGAKLDPDDAALIYLLAVCRRGARRNAEMWREMYQELCCRIISLLVAAGCRPDLRLADELVDRGEWEIIRVFRSGMYAQHIVTGPEGGKDALYLAQVWLGSDAMVKTIAGLSRNA